MDQPANIKVKKVDCLDDLKFQGMHLHKHAVVEIVSASDTLDAADSGKILLVDTDACVITLPGVTGAVYTIVNYADDGEVLITITPNSSDRISGCGLSTNENKSLYNTKLTAKKGDYVRLVGDVSVGWYIAEMRGTWAIQT